DSQVKNGGHESRTATARLDRYGGTGDYRSSPINVAARGISLVVKSAGILEIAYGTNASLELDELAVAKIRRHLAVTNRERNASASVPCKLDCELIAALVKCGRLYYAAAQQHHFARGCIDHGGMPRTMQNFDQNPAQHQDGES